MAMDKLKKRQGSKKTKKGWRKTDIQDVEAFLEDKRLEERLGASFGTREDSDLFTVDTAPDHKNLEKYEDALKERRKKWLSETPQCFKILESDSKVPDPVVKRNHVRTAEERKHPLLRKKEAEQRGKGILKAKELDRIRNRAIDAKRRKNKPVCGAFTKDLWEEDKSLPAEIISQWVGPSAREHNVANSKLKEMVIRYKKRTKPSIVSAIEAPHPGMSYNPSYLEHKDLLEKIVVKETKLLKQEAHLDRVTSKMFRKIPTHIAEAQWLKEMSEGVPVLDPEATKPDEFSPDNNEYQAINPPVTRDKKKNLKTRRKAREELQKKIQLQRAKIEHKKVSDIYRLKQIQKDLTDAEELQDRRLKKRQITKELNADKPKRLGPKKFEEMDLDFNQASDLKGSLRSMKPAGNLLADRFASFQKRNIMHATTKHIKHLSKKKKFSKASHKMDWEINPLTRHGYHQKKRQANSKALGQ